MDAGGVIALIKAIGGGGGSSGGGVLVVGATLDGETLTLDKTWQEINDAPLSVIVIQLSDNDISRVVITETLVSDSEQFLVKAYMQETLYSWMATSADGYPSMTID